MRVQILVGANPYKLFHTNTNGGAFVTKLSLTTNNLVTTANISDEEINFFINGVLIWGEK